MSSKSKGFPVPVQFKDEKKYSDVVDIFASHEATFETIFRADLERETCFPADFNFPSGGDQLTRV